MLRAIDLSELALGRTSPNPIVGAVVLDAAGAVVGEGYHHAAGQPHAEVEALTVAGEQARGGTVVATLEPCRAQGRVGACTDALIAAGVGRVVYAVPDPTAEQGGGAAVLRDAGIDVEGEVERARAESSNEAWLAAVRNGRPFGTVKLATSLDGRVAAGDGSSRWITSAPARADAHRLRDHSDAVVVGISTVLADDSHLTTRIDDELAARQPLRVVVDSTAKLPLDARVLDGAAPTLVATTDAADATRLAALREKAEVVVLPASADGHTDVPALLGHLASRGVVSVLVEGGPILAGAFGDQRLVDRLVVYVAPVVLGGEGRPAFAGHGAATIADAWRLRLDSVDRIGPDVKLVARPAAGGA